MVLRVSTSSFLSGGSNAIGQRRFELATLQQQLTTGHKTETLGGDPSVARKALRDESILREVASARSNIGEAGQLLAQLDTPLQSVVTTLQRIHELAVQFRNDTTSPTDRVNAANELRDLRARLVELANTRAGDRYVFGGIASALKPFDDSGPAVAFVGDTGQLSVPIGKGQTVNATLPGGEPFIGPTVVTGGVIAGGAITGVAGTDAITINGVNIGAVAVVANDADSALRNAINAASGVTGVTAALDATGTRLVLTNATGGTIDVVIDGATAGPSSGLTDDTSYGDTFAMIDALDTALRTGNGTQIGELIDDVSAALERASKSQATVGNSLNRLDGVRAVLDGIESGTEATLSAERDTDVTDAATRLKVSEEGLQAALVMTSRFEGLDLVSLLGR